jgi:endonuclease G
MNENSLERATLNALLNDREVMEELRNLDGQLVPPGFELAGAHTSVGEQIELLLEGAPGRPINRAMEAIIKITGRPALLVQNNTFEAPRLQAIRSRLEKSRSLLERAIPAVARIDLLNHPDYTMLGTGWMVEEDIMITNRHVAGIFARHQGDRVVFDTTPFGKPYVAQVDFVREFQTPRAPQPIVVREVLHLEAKIDLAPDLAFLRVEPSPLLPPPIALSSRRLALDEQLDVAAIGFPAWDGSRNNTFVMDDIFDGIYEVKRLAPGRVAGVHPRGHIFMHDCTTLGGNSGSVLIDLEAGQAIGLHYAGLFMRSNYAVTSHLIEDRLARMSRRSHFVVGGAAAAGSKERTTPDRPADLGQRAGYDPNFLGADHGVALPDLSAGLQSEAATIDGQDENQLRYRHFSVVMHKGRRMAIYTACNIDGNLLYNIKRQRDQWWYDPRLDTRYQAGEELYSDNKIQRGHLVRRLDPVWGPTRDEAAAAMQDTFFWTNCTPQHQNFNPRSWLALEDYILENADAENLKVSVFTGPVFADTDKTYRGFRIPEEYWKVVAAVNQLTGRLSATAYIVSQKDYLNDLEFVFGEFRTYHVPIRTVEEKTGLEFNLIEFDPLGNIETIISPVRVIEGPGDIVL